MARRILIEDACEHGWWFESHWVHDGTKCPGGSRRVLDSHSFVLAAQTCSECGGSFGQCFQSKLKCCPDCNHFPNGRDLVQWWDALAVGGDS